MWTKVGEIEHFVQQEKRARRVRHEMCSITHRKEVPMKTFMLLGLSISLVFAGCQKNPEEPSELDEQAIRDIMKDSEWFEVNEHFEGAAVDDSGSADTTHVIKDTIVPILWGRMVTGEPDSKAEITVIGDSAFVSFTIHTVGTLSILGLHPDSGWVGIDKPLSETFQLYAIFKRTGTATDPHRGWELTDISGASGRSDSVSTVRIDSVRIQSMSYADTVLRDPLDIFPVENAISLISGEQVTLTVYANGASHRLFLHVFVPIWPWHVRLPFENGGDGTYTGVWNVQLIPAVRFAVFDCLHYGTLHDDEYPYDFDGWLFPYVVHLTP